MPFTPVFGWPYQARGEAPHGPNLGEKLALAVEATVAPVAAGVNRMGVTLQRVALQTLPDNTNTTVSWDQEDEDTHNLWSSGTTVTIPFGGTGIWSITFQIQTVLAATARSLIAIIPSAGTWSGGSSPLRNSYGVGEDTCSVSGTIPLLAGDTFTCLANVDMSGASSMIARLSAYRVGL